MNLNELREFFRRFPDHKIASVLALVAVLSAAYLGVAGARSDWLWLIPNEGEPSPAASEATSSCATTWPRSGDTVGGMFTITASCPRPIQGKTVYVLLRDVFPYPDHGDARPKVWIQCEAKVKNNGDLLCGAFGCIDNAQYEILLVLPGNDAARQVYERWFLKDSGSGKEQLPVAGEVESVGENWSVTLDHSLAPPSGLCFE